MKIIKHIVWSILFLALLLGFVLLLISFALWVNPIEIITKVFNWSIVRGAIAILIVPLTLVSMTIDAMYD